MRLLIGLAILIATPAFAAERPETPRRLCPAADLQPAQQQPQMRSGLRLLGDAPPAHHMLTVERRIDGCPVPVIVRYRVDEKPARPAPRS